MVFKAFTPSPGVTSTYKRENKENYMLRKISATSVKKKKKNSCNKINQKDIVSAILSADKLPSRELTPRAKLNNALQVNKTVEKIMEDHGINLKSPESKKQIIESVTDIFDSNMTPKPVRNIKDCINKLFEGVDDYAAFSVSKTLKISTPVAQRKKYSNIDSDIEPTPRVSSPFDHNSLLAKSLLSESISSPMRDRNYFCYLPFSNVSNVSFDKAHDEGQFRTPFTDRSNKQTDPKPLSGVRCLDVRTPFSNDSFAKRTSAGSLDSPSTPHCSNKSIPFRNSLRSEDSADILPPEVKKNLLCGVICYVDVKTNNENCSKSVALELVSMGATVEKTLNKKVTHVVFKEGRPSTYTKAKKQGVFIVSVLWIEACKKAGKVVDPKIYPPADAEKLDSISPSAVKLPSLKTLQQKLKRHLLREAGIAGSTRSLRSSMNLRNAVTDLKDKTTANGSSGRLCTKKLDFTSEKTDSTKADEVINISSDHSQLDNTSSFGFDPLPENRRQSAPARLLPKRKRKDEIDSSNKKTKLLTIDQMFKKQICTQNSTAKNPTPIVENKENVPPKLTTISDGKRKRLFNPEDSPIVIDCSFDESVQVVNPYSEKKDDTVQTNSSKKRFKMTSATNKKAKKSLATLLEQEESPSHSWKSSLSLFVDGKKREPKTVKESPSIVCTSLSPAEVQKVAYITGKLGIFDIEDKVSSKTTHLVTPNARRTINLLKGIVRGCWILDVDWVYKSEVAGGWLNEEDFEMKSLSPAVVECRLERQAFGPLFCSELFASCGPLYISKSTSPPHADLSELIRLCKGKVAAHSKAAKIVIGGKIKENETVIRLKEKWILDCIYQNQLLDTHKYRIIAK